MFRHLTIAACALLLTLFMVNTANALTIKSIRGGAHPDKMRLVLEMDDVADFRVSLADGPRRLVVELPEHNTNERAVLELNKVGITELREEGAGSRTRLNFLLSGPVKVISAFMLPRDAEKPDRLVIDYRRIAADEFGAATKQSLGTLSEPRASSGILGVLSRQGSSSSSAAPLSAAPANNTGPRVDADHNDDNDQVNADPANRSGARKYVIVIDAGHGGKDPGAIGVGRVQEKNVTLAAAQELARQLERTGRYKAVLTRNSDRYLLLPERVRVARRAKGDLFVSLHADMAAGSSDAGGLSIYTLSDTASDAQTEKLAAQENKVDLLAGVDLSHEQQEVANILIDLAMRENMNQSRFFAGKVVKSMSTTGIDLLERPHRYAGFAVLKAPDIPSVLVEMGFLSNPDECRRLLDEAHRRRLMSGLVSGIDAYFAQLEKNQRL